MACRIYLALLFGIRKMRSSMFVASGTPQLAPQGVLGDGPHAMTLNKYGLPPC